MKLFFLFLLFFLISNCNKQRTVLICGDHICINKKEAEQYFKENLTIEVKVINKEKQKEVDLVELNLRESQSGKKRVSVSSISQTRKDLKTLSNEEIRQIKKNIKEKNKKIKIAKKSNDKNIVLKNNINKKKEKIFDVCTKLKKCSIDEISKYLTKQGKNKKFPDITKRQD